MIHSIMAPQARICKIDLLIIIFILIQSIRFCASASIIIPNKPFSDGEVLVSPKQGYALGFFRPGNSDRRYLGIWFNKVSEHTIIWVANRDNPLNDTSGVVSFNKAGNLVLTSNTTTTTTTTSSMNSSVMSSPLWSTNVTLEEGAANNNHNVSLMEARLLDSGNLVVVQKGSEKVLWQSFEHPTHTSIPFMRVGLDRRTGVNRVLTSWSSKDDPGTGAYTYGIDPTGVPQLVVYKGSNITWRAGPFNGLRWSGTPEMSSGIILNTTYTDNASEVTITYGPIVNGDAIFARLVIDDSGLVQGFTWQEADRTWFQFWSAPKDVCDSYRRCGAYSYCDPNPNWNSAEFECHCLPGFRPRSPRNWGLRDGSGGCVRSSGPNSICRKGEGFVKFSQVKVPDTRVAHVDRSLSVEACEQACLRNCTCMAYTSANVSEGGSGTGCLTWHGDLVDIKKYSVAGQGQDLYIRSDAVELANAAKTNVLKGSKGFRGAKRIAVIAIAPTVFAAFLLLLFYCFRYGKHRRLRGDSQQGNHHTSLIKLFMSYKNKVNGTDSEESGKNINLTFFNLREIKTATANFSNKLGQGGFGPVYKGHMSNGQEIAVKRLSKHSGQGAEEFKNEVLLIAKLQHKNLVKLLGCCIEGTELMLVYEYMPNKSLDSFIFDDTKKKLLDWPRRHEIIIGIARGVLYLHQDSRLTIVHRDLKASNVLLDEEMNPKISDFGMARIFGGNQTHANTNRVVGTFGYMSPEYALDGLFSMKSDVFSFGVLLLEIISGTKNYALFSEDIRSNLIRHTWDLWTVGMALDIVDPSMAGSWQDVEVLRCIQVGLLCVQDEAADRPTMSTVVFMLSNETTLPFPKQPGFAIRKSTTRRGDSTSASTDPGSESCTKNKLTMTAVEPR